MKHSRSRYITSDIKFHQLHLCDRLKIVRVLTQCYNNPLYAIDQKQQEFDVWISATFLYNEWCEQSNGDKILQLIQKSHFSQKITMWATAHIRQKFDIWNKHSCVTDDQADKFT